MIAEAVTAAQPTGNYAIIKGQEGQTNPEFLREGWPRSSIRLIEAGDITIPEGAEVYTDEWLPDNAQTNMENILTTNNNDIQAVLAENDGMAGGVDRQALDEQGLVGEVVASADRMATSPPSTASRSARRSSASGRTRPSSVRPPAWPPSRSATTLMSPT